MSRDYDKRTEKSQGNDKKTEKSQGNDMKTDKSWGVGELSKIAARIKLTDAVEMMIDD